MSPEGYSASLTAVAIAMAQGRTVKEIALMSATLSQLSSVLSTIAFTKELSEGGDDILLDIIH